MIVETREFEDLVEAELKVVTVDLLSYILQELTRKCRQLEVENRQFSDQTEGIIESLCASHCDTFRYFEETPC